MPATPTCCVRASMAAPVSEPAPLGEPHECRYLSVRFSEHTIGRPALRWDGPGLTRGCGAGLTLHSHLPAYAGLLVGSTSSHRATPGGVELGREGGQVLCSVAVAVDDQAARFAVVFALGQ